MAEPTTTTTAARAKEPDDSEPTPGRQAELREVYEANVAVGKPPYAGVVIGTRGELTWIIRERGWESYTFADTRGDLPDLRDSGIRCDMSKIDLREADLSGTMIKGTDFSDANLNGANLSGAYIAGSNFSGADLAGVNLSGAFIPYSSFVGADLRTADFGSAVVGEDEAGMQPDFSTADLRGANLRGATIAGTFAGADLTRARMDAATVFGGYHEESKVCLDTTTRLLDVSWNGATLALVNWDEVLRLGDEADIKKAATRKEQVQAYQKAVRAYYGLAKALEAQGLTATALNYRQRQHQLERAALIRDFKFGQWLFSSALNIVSGYGDRPGRALRAYLAIILVFASVYFGITNFGIFTSGSQPLQWYEAIVLSLTSFHGRGFFPQFSLGDPIAVVAALEAVVGLFIELVLIATFTRRLFER